MIHGTGCDLLKISRMKAVLGDTEVLPLYLRKTFTEAEQAEVSASHDPDTEYALHFCGKEAVFKSLGISSNTRFHWTDIEILHHETGQPYVVTHGPIDEICKNFGITAIHISLSCDTDYCMAQAISETSSD